MTGAIAWFAHNRVAANILMLLIVLSGLVVLPSIRVEVFPEFSADLVIVNVPYPGAAPAEVEKSICQRIEEELQGLAGVKRLSSTAAEGGGSVTVELMTGADTRSVLGDVKVRIDAIDSFPEEAEKPTVMEIVPRAQVINLAVHGQAEERSLRLIAERVRDELMTEEGITQVTMANARPYEISIELSELDMRKYRLSFAEVAAAVRSSSLDLPGGSIDTAGGQILLRTLGQAYRGQDFEEIVLRTNPDGTRLLLGEVARVVDGFAETDQAAQFDGEPAIVLQVFRVGEQNALDVSETVKSYAAKVRGSLPEGISVTTWRDDAKYLRGRIETLLRNGWQGLLLVFCVLTLFLRLRLSIWVSLGIPISFLGTIALMPALGQSINVLSLFAFIVVLGIVVDDAIVVGESVYLHLQKGESGEHAAIAGTKAVAVPVIFAVLTSVVAFAPMALLEGLSGKIWRVIPLVVIPTLLFSLIESQLILPSHLLHLKAERSRAWIARPWYAFQGIFSGGLEFFASHIYARLVRWALQWRYVTLAIALAILTITGGVLGSGMLKFVFFPKLPADDISVQLTMPQGTPVERTRQAVARMERVALELAADYEERFGEPVITHLLASVGEQPWRTAQAQNKGLVGAAFTGSHLGEVHIELTPSEDRDQVTADEVVRAWRTGVGAIEGAVELAFTSELMSAGKAIDLEFSHADTTELRAATEEFGLMLEGYPGVYGITDSFRAGKREVQLGIRPEAEALGLTLADLGRQVRQAFYGEEAQRVQRGRDEVKVMVRYPRTGRRSLAALEDMRIRLPDGAEVPFTTVASAEYGRGFATIQRNDRRRTINVSADVDARVATAGVIMEELREKGLPDLIARHPGLTWGVMGEQKEQSETLMGMMRWSFIGLWVIFGLMAIPFRSYLQPLIVMSAVPFGMVGAVIGHLITGLTMNVLSMCGLIALAGVVINDNLVLVTYINEVRARGGPLLEAVQTAGVRRFRPIILTSLTTFAGLTPLMLETSVQAMFLVPMAVSIAFGVIFSTAVSLVLVPSLYLILDDLKAATAFLLGRDVRAVQKGGSSAALEARS